MDVRLALRQHQIRGQGRLLPAPILLYISEADSGMKEEIKRDCACISNMYVCSTGFR